MERYDEEEMKKTAKKSNSGKYYYSINKIGDVIFVYDYKKNELIRSDIDFFIDEYMRFSGFYHKKLFK